MLDGKTVAKKPRKAWPADRSPGNDLEACEAPGCMDFARFAPPASPSPTRCSRHAAGGMIVKAKPRKACDVCTARKTRCDSVRPTCGTCAAQFATCRYSARLKSGPKASLPEQASQEHRAAEPSAAVAGGEQQQQQQLEGNSAIGDVAAEAAASNGAEGQPLIPPSMLLAAFSQDQAAVTASEAAEVGAAVAPALLPVEAGAAGAAGATVTTAPATVAGGEVPVEQLPLRSPSQGLNLLLLSQELQEAAGMPRPSAGVLVPSTKSPAERGRSIENGRGRGAGSKPAGSKPLRTSCDRCTMRKIKCDGREGTCQRCEKDNQFCHYSLKSKSGPKPNSIRRKSSPTPPRERSRPSSLSLANLPPGRIRGAPGRAAPPLTSRPSPAARSLAAATSSTRLAGAGPRANGYPAAAAAEGPGAADGAGKGPAASGTDTGTGVVVGGTAEPSGAAAGVADAVEAGGRQNAGAGAGVGVGRGMFSAAAGMDGGGGGAMAGRGSAKGHSEAVGASRETGMVF
ncbi:unnamed protein product [Ectocarpus fasciculatus]